MLQIRKKAEDVFKHYNEQGTFLLSRGYFKIDNGVFFIVEAGGARRNLYPISEITVYDDTDSGTPETFTTDIALYERLVELRYNLVETSSGGFVSDLTSSPQDYPFVDTNTFVLPNNYVIVSVHINGSLYKKAEYNKSGNNLLIIDSLEVGDIVEVRGVVAIGSFGTDGATTFLGLTDTPSTYIGQSGKFPKVNAGENGLEFDDVPSSGGTWGSITGTLSSQTDLQNALDLKAPLANPTFTGSVVVPEATQPTQATNFNQSVKSFDITGNNTALIDWNGSEVFQKSSGTLTISPITMPASLRYVFAISADTGVSINWAKTGSLTWKVLGLTAGVAPPTMTQGQMALVSIDYGSLEIVIKGL